MDNILIGMILQSEKSPLEKYRETTVSYAIRFSDGTFATFAGSIEEFSKTQCINKAVRAKCYNAIELLAEHYSKEPYNIIKITTTLEEV